MEKTEFQTIQVSKEAAVYINDYRCDNLDFFFREKDNIADAFSALEMVSDDDFTEKEVVRQTLSHYNALINTLIQRPES